MLGIWTGTCHSNFPAGRKINQSLSHAPGTSIGPEPRFWSCVQLTKNELKNGAQGHSNSQTGRVIKDNYRPKNLLREGSEADMKARQNSRKQISRGTLESPLKHNKRGTTSTMTHLPKRTYAFSPEYIQEKTHTPFLAKCVILEVVPLFLCFKGDSNVPLEICFLLFCLAF